MFNTYLPQNNFKNYTYNPVSDSGRIKMPVKASDGFLPGEVCCFCLGSQVNVLYGQIYKMKSIVTHYFCLLMASKIQQNGRDDQGILGFFIKDINQEIARGRNQVCFFCKKNGATVHCVNKSCARIFHLPCGVAKGTVHQFFGQFDSFCPQHKPIQTIPKSISSKMSSSCVICTNDVKKCGKYNVMWPVCCKPTSLIHRKCVQTLANSAGYYFKCPLCNNVKEFSDEMRKCGIYIPEQDASWESEPNAYAELNVRSSDCTAETCLCPKGADYNKNLTQWQIELCSLCGANGVHLACSGLLVPGHYKISWQCSDCKPAVTASSASCNQDSQSDEAGLESQAEPQAVPGGGASLLLRSAAALPEPVNSTLTQDDEDEDVDVVILSDDEQATKPEEKEVQNGENSDDDCQVISVIKRPISQVLPDKRRNSFTGPPGKRFRTPWAAEAKLQYQKKNPSEVGPIMNHGPTVLHQPMDQDSSGSSSTLMKVDAATATPINKVVTYNTKHTKPVEPEVGFLLGSEVSISVVKNDKEDVTKIHSFKKIDGQNATHQLEGDGELTLVLLSDDEVDASSSVERNDTQVEKSNFTSPTKKMSPLESNANLHCVEILSSDDEIDASPSISPAKNLNKSVVISQTNEASELPQTSTTATLLKDLLLKVPENSVDVMLISDDENEDSHQDRVAVKKPDSGKRRCLNNNKNTYQMNASISADKDKSPIGHVYESRVSTEGPLNSTPISETINVDSIQEYEFMVEDLVYSFGPDPDEPNNDNEDTVYILSDSESDTEVVSRVSQVSPAQAVGAVDSLQGEPSVGDNKKDPSAIIAERMKSDTLAHESRKRKRRISQSNAPTSSRRLTRQSLKVQESTRVTEIHANNTACSESIMKVNESQSIVAVAKEVDSSSVELRATDPSAACSDIISESDGEGKKIVSVCNDPILDTVSSTTDRESNSLAASTENILDVGDSQSAYYSSTKLEHSDSGKPCYLPLGKSADDHIEAVSSVADSLSEVAANNELKEHLMSHISAIKEDTSVDSSPRILVVENKIDNDSEVPSGSLSKSEPVHFVEPDISKLANPVKEVPLILESSLDGNGNEESYKELRGDVLTSFLSETEAPSASSLSMTETLSYSSVSKTETTSVSPQLSVTENFSFVSQSKIDSLSDTSPSKTETLSAGPVSKTNSICVSSQSMAETRESISFQLPKSSTLSVSPLSKIQTLSPSISSLSNINDSPLVPDCQTLSTPVLSNLGTAFIYNDLRIDNCEKIESSSNDTSFNTEETCNAAEAIKLDVKNQDLSSNVIVEHDAEASGNHSSPNTVESCLVSTNIDTSEISSREENSQAIAELNEDHLSSLPKTEIPYNTILKKDSQPVSTADSDVEDSKSFASMELKLNSSLDLSDEESSDLLADESIREHIPPSEETQLLEGTSENVVSPIFQNEVSSVIHEVNDCQESRSNKVSVLVINAGGVTQAAFSEEKEIKDDSLKLGRQNYTSANIINPVNTTPEVITHENFELKKDDCTKSKNSVKPTKGRNSSHEESDTKAAPPGSANRTNITVLNKNVTSTTRISGSVNHLLEDTVRKEIRGTHLSKKEKTDAKFGIITSKNNKVSLGPSASKGPSWSCFISKLKLQEKLFRDSEIYRQHLHPTLDRIIRNKSRYLEHFLKKHTVKSKCVAFYTDNTLWQLNLVASYIKLYTCNLFSQMNECLIHVLKTVEGLDDGNEDWTLILLLPPPTSDSFLRSLRDLVSASRRLTVIIARCDTKTLEPSKANIFSSCSQLPKVLILDFDLMEATS